MKTEHLIICLIMIAVAIVGIIAMLIENKTQKKKNELMEKLKNQGYERLEQLNRQVKEKVEHDTIVTKALRTKIQELASQLQEYEDKIKNGTLVELPLPIGADCWVVHNWHNKKLAGIKKWNFTYTVFELHWGDTAFATKEEAEAKLREIEFKQRVDCGNSAIVED